MVVNTTAFVEQFSRLGISESEGRLYVALLERSAVTAYEAAKAASIPTSKVYGVIDRLEARGMVRWDDRTGRKLYWPQPADEFIETTRSRLRSTLDSLRVDLEQVGPPPESSTVWPVNDEAALVEKATRMIETATKSLLVSGWNEELKRLAPRIAERRNAGVQTALVHFGPGSLGLENVFLHPIEDTIYAERGGRGLTVVADGATALVGTIRNGTVVEGAWSLNHAFVTLAEDYIKHDIYIMKIVHRMDGELQRRFGPNYRTLRDVWSDEEVES